MLFSLPPAAPIGVGSRYQVSAAVRRQVQAQEPSLLDFSVRLALGSWASPPVDLPDRLRHRRQTLPVGLAHVSALLELWLSPFLPPHLHSCGPH
jgi:hypothetical protein